VSCEPRRLRRTAGQDPSALQEKGERKSQAIRRPRTMWSFVAGIALVVAALEDWLFGPK
jgi:hypothetical protein